VSAEDCPICFDICEDSYATSYFYNTLCSGFIIGNCGHTICEECHVELLAARQCPICRGPMTKENLIPIAHFQQKFAPVEPAVKDLDPNMQALNHFSKKAWAGSTKISILVDIVKKIKRERPGEKTIVFSQFLGFLDLIDKPLTDAGISYGRFDGSVTAQKRDLILKQFAADPDMNVLLLSQKVFKWRLSFNLSGL
jgi:SNF2 family DNA or RNA helicase